MAIDQNNTEAICWAELATAPGARQRTAFKWENGQRVPSKDSRTGQQLVERLPLPAHYGSKMTGVRVANIPTAMKVLRHDGITVEVKYANGPAHETNGADSYEQNIRAKGRALGWIPVGECPAALVASGVIPEHTVLAPEARDGQPCSRHILGIKNPPCRHYVAEDAARVKAQRERQGIREEALKSEDAKAIESNAATVKATAEQNAALLQKQTETQAQLVALLASERTAAGKDKAGK